MKAGLLDKRILIESQTQTQDVFGQSVVTWATFKSVWGDVIELKDSERTASNQKMAEVDYRIRIRYYPGITTNMRVVYKSLNYDITGVQELGRREGQMLYVSLNKNMK